MIYLKLDHFKYEGLIIMIKLIDSKPLFKFKVKLLFKCYLVIFIRSELSVPNLETRTASHASVHFHVKMFKGNPDNYVACNH